jgi:hypothetical protein
VAVVELVWGSIGIPAFGEDENVGCATERIWEDCDRSKVDIRVAARCLASGRTIEVPFWEIVD